MCRPCMHPGGANQRFRASSSSRGKRAFCAIGGQHCVVQKSERQAGGATSPTIFAETLAPLKSRTAHEQLRSCTPDSPAAVSQCAGWASRGECHFSVWMQEHCATTCAKLGKQICRLPSSGDSALYGVDESYLVNLPVTMTLQVDELDRGERRHDPQR